MFQKGRYAIKQRSQTKPHISFSLSIQIDLSIYLSIYLSISVSLSYPSLYFSFSHSTCWRFSLSLSLSLSFNIYIYIYIYIYPYHYYQGFLTGESSLTLSSQWTRARDYRDGSLSPISLGRCVLVVYWLKRWTVESEYASSYSSRVITFTFGQIPLGKVWTPLSPSSYG